ncbi:MAG TPA: methionyl-tRNA formyltransferase [Candidatus Saccharimonadales bacterium]|nr:methionyl-tRNA formyltransferase [Candidatus Saccharimonadales bacterium]
MSSKTKLVFFGNERLATGASTDAPVLRALIAAGYGIEAVITSHKEPVSRQKRDLEIGPIAHAYHIPVVLAGGKQDLLSKVNKHRTEAAVLVAFGQIIPQEVLDVFPKGIINIHPSLLPKLRGSTPVETAILNGFEETGVSLMKLAAEMDAGPVYAQRKLALDGSETKFDLARKLNKMGAELLIENLDDILSGRLAPKTQDETEATYSRLLSKQDGHIDFNEPAEDIERKVRAFLGFPKTRAEVHGRDIVITRSRVAESPEDGGLVVKCSPGYLEILELIAPSGRTMGGAEFLRGYKR